MGQPSLPEFSDTRQAAAPLRSVAASPVALGLAHQAATSPDRLALKDGDRAITYAELESSVTAAAARIATIPVPQRSGTPTVQAPMSVLPVVVDRTYRSAIALHAAVRAGRSFAALESTLPPARLEELFFALGAPAYAVVADPAMASRLPGWVRAVSVEEPAGDPGGFEPVAVHENAPGYVLFTSGSSGRPKGVVRRWGALTEKLSTERRPQRTAQVHSFGFAVGLGQLTRLAAGDALYLADARHMTAEQLLEWLHAGEMTAVNLGTALTATLLRVSRGDRRLPLVTTLYLAGEPATWDLVAPVRMLIAADASIVSYFGASEAGEVMRHCIGPDDPIGRGELPIGAAGSVTRVRLEPIDGPESPMEMIVRDPLALEYLGEPELTSQRFFTDEAGIRWWRSGDKVGFDDQGRYVHRGRIDDMVKINGRRVELAEAESAVRALPGISEAVVVVHTTPRDRRLLVAHVVIDDDALTPAVLRSWLGLLLPAHLTPAVLMRHDRLPLNDRGKVDVAALRAMAPVPWRLRSPRKSYSERENWLAGLVARLVDLGEVGVDDDIWDAGLDSLGAIELCAAIADAGQGEIAPPALMQHTTPAKLARFLASAAQNDPSPAVILNPIGTRPALFAIPGGGGTALAFRSLAHALGADQPFVVVEPRGMHHPGTVACTIEEMAAHAVECIGERVGPGQRCVVMGYSAGATVAFEACRRLVEAARAVHLVLLDGAPRGRSPGVPDEDPRAGRVEPGMPGSSGMAPNDLYAHRLSVFRGGPGYYEEFRWILRDAIAAYELRPVAVEATLIQLHGGDLAAECRRWVNVVAVHEVGGDHQTMLHPPHVGEMAGIIATVLAPAR